LDVSLCQIRRRNASIAIPSPTSISLRMALLFSGIRVIDVMTAERGNKEKRL